jgi:hypothetical protein
MKDMRRIAMKRNVLAASVAGLAALCLAAVAHAHHSHAMFDSDNVKTVTGTVVAVRFQNPHVYLQLRDASYGEGGATMPTYNLEMSAVGHMISMGITTTTFEVGQKVVLDIQPLRSGAPGGAYVGIRAVNGIANADTSMRTWKPSP